jgi:hypothetical protein
MTKRNIKIALGLILLPVIVIYWKEIVTALIMILFVISCIGILYVAGKVTGGGRPGRIRNNGGYKYKPKKSKPFGNPYSSTKILSRKRTGIITETQTLRNGQIKSSISISGVTSSRSNSSGKWKTRKR